MWRAFFAPLLVVGQVVFYITAFAQCPDQWVTHISAIPSGGLSGPRPGIATDQNGNIVYSGRVSPLVDSIAIDGVSIDYPGIPSTNDFGLMVVKLSAFGSLLWFKPISGVKQNEPLDMVVDSIGDIYIGGRITGTLSLDGVTIEGPDSARSGYFIIKLNSDGEYQWHKSTTIRGSRCYDVEWVDDFGLICTIPFNGSVEIGGVTYFSDTPEYQDILLVRISADGQDVIYMNKLGGSGNISINSVTCDSNGCVAQGRFSGGFQADQFALSTPNDDHYYLYHGAIELNGDVMWVNHSTNLPNGANLFSGLGVNSISAVFCGQSPFSWIEYGGLTITEVTEPDQVFTRYFLGSLNRANGDVSWFKPIISGFTSGSPGHVIHSSSGTWLSTVHFDSTLMYEGYQILNSNSSIFRLDPDGKPDCGIGIGGTIGSILRNSDGHLVASLEFDGHPSIEVFGQSLVSHGGLFDVAIAKTCLPCDTLTSVTEQQAKAALLSIYPNPASQSVRVEATGSHAQAVGITITNMLGQSALSLPFREVGEAINISNLANGIYTIAATMQSGETLRQRLVVQH